MGHSDNNDLVGMTVFDMVTLEDAEDSGLDTWISITPKCPKLVPLFISRQVLTV